LAIAARTTNDRKKTAAHSASHIVAKMQESPIFDIVQPVNPLSKPSIKNMKKNIIFIVPFPS
jgi:hypothetical protein